MSLQVKLYTESKLDPRYSRNLCSFDADFLLTYFNIRDENNLQSIAISSEAFHNLLADMRNELSSHKGTYLPKNFGERNLVVNPSCEKLVSRNGRHGGLYWDDMRYVYGVLAEILKRGDIDFDKDNLKVIFCLH